MDTIEKHIEKFARELVEMVKADTVRAVEDLLMKPANAPAEPSWPQIASKQLGRAHMMFDPSWPQKVELSKIAAMGDQPDVAVFREKRPKKTGPVARPTRPLRKEAAASTLLARLAPKTMTALVQRMRTYVSKHPRCRTEEIARGLRVPTETIKPLLAACVEAGVFTSEGRTRGMRYALVR
jgi:hypothetical protein